MKVKLIILFIALFSLAMAANAQNVTITGTITDTQSTPYSNGSLTVTLVNTTGQQATFGGNPAFQRIYSATLSSTGAFSINLPPNSTTSPFIQPPGTQWNFSYQSQGGYGAANVNITITAAGDISGTISNQVRITWPILSSPPPCGIGQGPAVISIGIYGCSSGAGFNPASPGPIGGSVSNAVTVTCITSLVGNPWIDITCPPYNAIGDAKVVADASTTVSSTTITSASAAFTAGDVGKQFSVTPTFYSTTGQLTGTIATFVNSTTITVSITSGTATTSTNARLTWGTDNTTAIQAAITAAQALAKDGDPSATFIFSGIPPIVVPAPSPGRGYIVSGPLNIIKQGVTIQGPDREATNLILNAAGAQINFTAPSGTFHSLEVKNMAIQCNYVATTGLNMVATEESDFSYTHVDNCLTAGISLNNSGGSISGLIRMLHSKLFGNQCAVLFNQASHIDLIGASIYGQSGTTSTLSALCFKGTGTDIVLDDSYVEGVLNVLKFDNSAGAANNTVTIKSTGIVSTITENRVISASSANVNSQLFANVFVEGNTVTTTNATHWADLFLNSNVAAGTAINVVWEKNTRNSGPSGTLFNTDSASIVIVYQNNNGVSGANIVSGAASVLGYDCGGETGIGSFVSGIGFVCNLRGLTGKIAGSFPPVASSTAVTSTNPTINVDQNLIQLSLQAGYFNTLSQPFTITGSGIYSSTTASTPALNFEIKLCTISACGSGTVVDLADITTTALNTTALTNATWNLVMTCVTNTTGATGNLMCHGSPGLTLDTGATLSAPDTLFSDTNTAVLANIDLTAALFVQFTVAQSVVGTSNSYTQQLAAIR